MGAAGSKLGLGARRLAGGLAVGLATVPRAELAAEPAAGAELQAARNAAKSNTDPKRITQV